MTRRYSAFLVRCWGLGRDVRRFEVQHIQSDARVRADSLTAALAWIEARLAAANGPAGAAPSGGQGEAGGDDAAEARARQLDG